MTAVTLILQTVFSLLVIAALGYGVRLNRKLVELRDGQAKFAAAVTELDRAAARAESGLHALRTSTDMAEAELAGRIEAARELAGKLAALNSDAAMAVKRLENARRGTPSEAAAGRPEDHPRAGAGAADAPPPRPRPSFDRGRDARTEDRPESAVIRPHARRDTDLFAAAEPSAAEAAAPPAAPDTADRLRRVAELLRAPDDGRGRNTAGARP